MGTKRWDMAKIWVARKGTQRRGCPYHGSLGSLFGLTS